MTSTIGSSDTLCAETDGESTTKSRSSSLNDQSSICSEAEKDLGVPVLEGWPLGSTVFAYVEADPLLVYALIIYQTVSSFTPCNSRYYHNFDLADHNRFRLGSLRSIKLDPGVLSTNVLWLSTHIHSPQRCVR